MNRLLPIFLPMMLLVAACGKDPGPAPLATSSGWDSSEFCYGADVLVCHAFTGCKCRMPDGTEYPPAHKNSTADVAATPTPTPTCTSAWGCSSW